jgi:hypothetical protein
MSKKYKIISISIHEGLETQHYIAEAFVTEGQILSGDDSGVLCLCMSLDAAGLVLSAMNEWADKAPGPAA